MLLASSAVPLVGFRGSVSAMMRRFLATILVSSLILLSSGEPAMAVSKPPSTPTNVGISDCIESCQPMVISTLTPTVFATSTDVDSPQLSYGLELRIRSASSLLGTYAGSTVPPGTQGQVQIPGGILSDGEVYEFRLRISDGSGYAPATWIAFQPKLAADTPTRVWGFPKLVGDVTWSPAGSPYVLEGGVEVGQGATLRLTPGTIVKERGGFIYVTAGRLLARGNAASPIHFTSIEDDSVGGDSGQDGPTQGSAGNFSTILTISTTAEQADQAGTSIIENAAFRYGGWYSPARCYADRGMIKLSGEARLSIERSAFSDTATTAISMEDTGRWGLGLVRVSRSLFERMGTCALDTQGAKAIIEANVFADTDSAPISTLSDPGHGVTVRDNWFYGALSHFTNLQPAITREDIDYRGNAFMGSFGNAPAGYLDPEDLGGNYWPSNVGSFPFCIAPGVPVAHYVPPVDVRYNSSCPSTSEAYRLFTKVAPYGAPPAQPQVGLEAEPSTAGSVLAGQLMGVGSAEFARNPSGFQADPVNTANGAYVEQAVDATLPVLGGQLSLDRTYNSVDETAGPLGRGWTWGMAPRLKVSANGEAMLTAPDGQQATFFRDDVAGTFVPAPGVTAELTLEDDGYDVVAQSDLRYRFDIDGAIRSITDRNGNAISYQYDDGRITRIASGGRGFDLEWDGERLTKATLPDGRYVAYGYTGGLLTSVHGTDGQAITYTYDSGGRLITKTDQLGHVQVALAYGQTGRVVQQTNALGKVSLFTWDEESSTATLIDPRGGRWKDVYRGNVLVERRDPVGGTTTYEYDARMRLVATEDVRGFRSTFVWSGEDLVSARTSLGVTTFEHDSRGDLVATHDALGRTSVRVLDERGNVVRVERGGQQGQAPQVSTFDYDAAGFLVREVTPMGRLLERTRNAHGDVTSLRATSGATTQMGYDEVGRLTSVTTPRGQTTQADDDFTTTMGFDDGDRVVAVVDPRGRESQNTYDAAGRLLTSTDRAGRETTFSYRDDNTLSTRKGPDSASQPMRFAYDDNANLVSVTDPSGRTQSYGYDLANRVVSTSGPSGAYSYKLDAAGNVITETAPGNKATNYRYTAAGSLLSVAHPSPMPAVYYRYDAMGKRASMQQGNRITTYQYDGFDNLTSVKTGTQAFTYSYDLDGQLVSSRNPLGVTTSYEYDEDARLSAVSRNGSLQARYAYDVDSNPVGVSLGDGSSRTQTFDDLGRVSRLRDVAEDGRVILDDRLTYDEADNPVQMRHADDSTDSYAYDILDRLTRVCFGSATCDEQAIHSVSWTYDAVGNRTSESRGGATTTYDRDPATGRLTSTVGPSGSTAYSYDAAGRLLTAGDATLAYDSAGRLVSEQRGGGGATNYTYDGDGRRLSATTGAETTNFLWDPSNYLLNATTNRDGAATADVTYGLGPVAETRGGDTSALHTDTAGSVVEMTDGSGASVGTASFEPYGVERGRSGARSVLGWEGQLQDVAGSYHLRARQYHPDLGQFVAPDPARAVLDSATYSYANSNPMTTSDPLGLWPTDGTIGDAVGYVGSNVAGMFGVGVVLQAFRACEGSEKGSCGADVVAMAVVGGAGKGLGKAARAARGAGSVAAKTGTVGVDDVLNGVRLRAQLTGQEISGGHAFEKHILDLGEFPGIRTRAQFASHIEDVVLNGEMRTLGGGRTAFWRDGTVVIRNPRAPDGGTVFQPTDGYDYFLNQLH